MLISVQISLIDLKPHLLPPWSRAGNSGMGCYHGKFSFDQLSHLRGCLIKQLKMEGVNSMRYPPHTAKKLGWARFFILNNVDAGWIGRMALVAVLVVVAAVVLQVSHRGGRRYDPLASCVS